MLTHKTVGHVETSQLHAAVAVWYGHIVSAADVCTKIHQMRRTVELLRLDLLVDGEEMRPTTERQCDVLGRCNHRGYAHRMVSITSMIASTLSTRSCLLPRVNKARGGSGGSAASSTTAAAAATSCSTSEIDIVDPVVCTVTAPSATSGRAFTLLTPTDVDIVSHSLFNVVDNEAK